MVPFITGGYYYRVERAGGDALKCFGFLRERKLLVILLLATTAGSASAGRISLGMTSLQAPTALGATAALSLSGAGINISTLPSVPWGMVTDFSVVYVLSGSVNNAALDMNVYDKARLTVDALVGLGYQITVSPSLLMTFGVGPQVNLSALMGSSGNAVLTYIIGVAALTKAEYMFNNVFGLYLSAKGAYDFLAVDFDREGLALINGVVLAASGGVSFHW